MVYAFTITEKMELKLMEGKTREEVLEKLRKTDFVWHANVRANNGPFIEAVNEHDARAKLLYLVNSQLGDYMKLTLG